MHNASNALRCLPLWYYLSRPSNLACHNLTTYLRPPPNIHSLLGLGLKFCPIPKTTFPDYSDCHKRFTRDAYVKDVFANEETQPHFNPRLYVRSTWEPKPSDVAPITIRRTNRFLSSTIPLFSKQRGRSNLLPHQKRLLQTLQQRQDLIVIQCDKNLGPALIERQQYIRLIYRDHLNDTNTYQYMSIHEAKGYIDRIAYLLRRFIKTHRKSIGRSSCLFLVRSLNAIHKEKGYTQNFPPSAFAQFYALAKVHKQPLKTRPVVSYCGSILHPLGLWLDSQLQTIATHQQSYFKSSHALKLQMEQLTNIPPSALLFTADAVSMYTNIDTTHALQTISDYLHRNTFVYRDLPIRTIIDGLRLLMNNTIFQFGDTWWRQKTGTAMGAPPAPPYATIYYGIHEN